MTDMYRIVLRLRGVSKIAKKVLTYFMDGPLENLLRAMMHGQASKTSKATKGHHCTGGCMVVGGEGCAARPPFIRWGAA